MDSPRIAVIGLGYVGLPLAVALAKHFPVLGFDVKRERVAELREANDRTHEVSPAALQASSLRFADDPDALTGHDVYIITVPTPVDANNRPDLGPVIAACRTVGAALRKGAIVVLESTVYPGVTEGVCGPELERISRLQAGTDFFLGYSPERINPGDREHTIDRITKVVAAQTPKSTERLAAIYGAITKVFVARDIKTAEAAKVIENAQRDINIAFINEVTMIFNRLGLSIYDVLAAAQTKWNFLPFAPGFVGGHCIGVDPFYLADLAQRLGHNPEVILAGRRINDGMGEYVASAIVRELDRADITPGRPHGRRALVLGLTFKENVPDLRNSRVVDMIAGLKSRGVAVDVHDPLADPAEARREYGIVLQESLDGAQNYDVVIAAVGHNAYRALTGAQVAHMLRPGALVADIKGIWKDCAFSPSLRRWQP